MDLSSSIFDYDFGTGFDDFGIGAFDDFGADFSGPLTLISAPRSTLASVILKVR